MHRVSTVLHLHVAYDDITGHLANDNDNYKFFACPHSILQEFAVENEVMVTSQPKIGRELHVQCTCSSKVLKRFAFITDELDVPWDFGIRSVFSNLVTTYASLELSSLVVDSSQRPASPPPWF